MKKATVLPFGMTREGVMAGAGQHEDRTVSLGIFRELENATQRRDAVAALGYAPIIEPRTEQVPEWWIDLATAPGFDWRALLPAPELQAREAPCG